MMRLAPDWACAENTSANVVASQKVSRTTAFKSFMVLLLFLCASVCGFSFNMEAESQLTLCAFDVRRDIA
jgi:hypothetical protein